LLTVTIFWLCKSSRSTIPND